MYYHDSITSIENAHHFASSVELLNPITTQVIPALEFYVWSRMGVSSDRNCDTVPVILQRSRYELHPIDVPLRQKLPGQTKIDFTSTP